MTTSFTNMHNDKNIVGCLPVELWDQIFSILWNSLLEKPQSHPERAFLVANSSCRYLRYATWHVRRYMLMTMSNSSIDAACRKGNLSLLNWWRYESGIPTDRLPHYYTTHSIGHAAEFNRLAVLNWWKTSGLPMKYDGYALEKATEKGHKEILVWWKENKLKMMFRGSPVDVAQKKERWDLVEWWLRSSGQPVTFTFDVNLLLTRNLLVV